MQIRIYIVIQMSNWWEIIQLAARPAYNFNGRGNGDRRNRQKIQVVDGEILAV